MDNIEKVIHRLRGNHESCEPAPLFRADLVAASLARFGIRTLRCSGTRGQFATGDIPRVIIGECGQCDCCAWMIATHEMAHAAGWVAGPLSFVATCRVAPLIEEAAAGRAAAAVTGPLLKPYHTAIGDRWARACVEPPDHFVQKRLGILRKMVRPLPREIAPRKAVCAFSEEGGDFSATRSPQ